MSARLPTPLPRLTTLVIAAWGIATTADPPYAATTETPDMSTAPSRLVAAAPEQVWKAWSEADAFLAWSFPLPDGFRVETFEFRTGGAFRAVPKDTGWDGDPLDLVFREVVETERIVVEVPNPQGAVTMTCTLEAEEGGTRVTLVASGADGRADPQMAEQCHMLLDRLDQHVTGGRVGAPRHEPGIDWYLDQYHPTSGRFTAIIDYSWGTYVIETTEPFDEVVHVTAAPYRGFVVARPFFDDAGAPDPEPELAIVEPDGTVWKSPVDPSIPARASRVEEVVEKRPGVTSTQRTTIDSACEPVIDDWRARRERWHRERVIDTPPLPEPAGVTGDVATESVAPEPVRDPAADEAALDALRRRDAEELRRLLDAGATVRDAPVNVVSGLVSAGRVDLLRMVFADGFDLTQTFGGGTMGWRAVAIGQAEVVALVRAFGGPIDADDAFIAVAANDVDALRLALETHDAGTTFRGMTLDRFAKKLGRDGLLEAARGGD